MDREELQRCYRDTRETSTRLAAPLAPEDYRIQSMPDVSPPWWNLGHTSWFFAKNILEPYAGYRFPDPGLEFVLNSYYQVHGPRLARAERGLVTRPSTEEILDFRREVDERMFALIEHHDGEDGAELEFLVVTGIHHEQQHQELMVTEVKHILGTNVPGLRRPYHRPPSTPNGGPFAARDWIEVAGGLERFGNLEGGWCWDNELPVHRAYNAPFAIANRLITVGELLEFVEDGGYRDPMLWLANGWDAVQRGSWGAPMYWERRDGEWQTWTLAGDRPLDPDEPVSHVSYYEADAYATWLARVDSKWRGARLPTEREWEQAARTRGFPSSTANFLESGAYHPRPAAAADHSALLQAAGDLWEWTSSHYEPYPGYLPFDGALMEYNGKFMDNQRVLRGGSCATPTSHIRTSYRNFWPADTRFQFTGIRLAKTLG